MSLTIKIYQRQFQPHAGKFFHAFIDGLKLHGINAEWLYDRSYKPSDLAVIWGMRFPQIIKGQKENGNDFLVMERGYVGDRMKFTSMGFNGLNNRADFHAENMPDDRWDKYFDGMMKHWKTEDGYILLIGQVAGDSSIKDRIILTDWLNEVVAELSKIYPGKEIVFRPHPLSRQNQNIPGTENSNGSLEQDLSGAGLCVTFNSNTGVEAVLAGVPTITMDRGAMAYNVTSHALDVPICKPDREQWAYDMAYKQWMMEEIASGEAWEHLKQRYV